MDIQLSSKLSNICIGASVILISAACSSSVTVDGTKELNEQERRILESKTDVGGKKCKTRPTYMVEPDFSAEMARDGLGGTVKLSYIVDLDGNVTDIEVIEAPNEVVKKSVIDAVTRWKYEPPTCDGENSSMRKNLTMNLTG